MTPGLISVFCASGTVLGLILIVFGMTRKSNSMKIGGVICFVVCFGGLLLLLAKFGEKPDEARFSGDSVRWRIEKWELRSENTEGKTVRKDLTTQWDGKIYLIIEDKEARFGDNGKTFINRGFSATDSTWNFLIGPSPEAPPLSGSYNFSSVSPNEAILTKENNGQKEILWLRTLD